MQDMFYIQDKLLLGYLLSKKITDQLEKYFSNKSKC